VKWFTLAFTFARTYPVVLTAPGVMLRQNEFRKSQWESQLWITRAAVVLGVAAVGIGVKDPRLFQVKIVGFLAIAAMALSAYAIGVSLWKVNPRSRRLRQPIFWISILVNLALIAAVGFFFARGTSLPPDYRNVVGPSAQDNR
jgi:tetrahydromethanopterin S-methyltransferase subunit E